MTFADSEAERLLATDGPVPLDAIAWLSAHTAAVGRVIYPVVRRSVPDGSQVVTHQRAIASQLSRTLRVVERRYSGDVLAAGLDKDQMLHVLRSHLAEHQAAQTDLVDLLDVHLSDSQQLIVIAAYQQALEHAPTRPHPHLGRGRLMFRLGAFRDKALDIMDGRNTSVPRVARRQIAPGRWGSYVLGQQHHRDADDS